MIMNKRITLWERYVLSKLMLVATLFILGGNLAMAEEVNISFENSYIPSDWSNGGMYGSITYNAFTASENGITTANTWSTYSLTSNNSFNIENGSVIQIEVRLSTSNASSPSLKIRHSSDGSTFTDVKEFTKNDISDANSFTTLKIENVSGNNYIQILGIAVCIKSFKIQPTSSTVIFDENNSSEFTSKTYQEASVKYTSYKGWNTICMPFLLRSWSVNYMNDLFGTGWSAYTLSAYSDGILTFSKIAASGYIQANTPLLVEAPNATGTQVELNLTNLAVTHSDNPQASAGGATFQGTYAPIDMEGKYGVTGNGTIQKGGAGSNMPGYRAYFTGVSAPADGARPTIVFSEEEMPTGIGAVQLLENTKDVYNLNGQKVAQTRKGIYIVNGRKIVVK